MKFEYRIEHINYHVSAGPAKIEVLNSLGQDGWELVAVAVASANANGWERHAAYLKRPLNSN
jgi:hypothetical protein